MYDAICKLHVYTYMIRPCTCMYILHMTTKRVNYMYMYIHAYTCTCSCIIIFAY